VIFLFTFWKWCIIDYLSDFSCAYNKDIETFLRNNAIDFSNRGIARTHLVTGKIDDKDAILGYFTLANKILTISSNNLSKSMAKKIERFGLFDIQRQA
jgi:hypothetical protein